MSLELDETTLSTRCPLCDDTGIVLRIVQRSDQSKVVEVGQKVATGTPPFQQFRREGPLPPVRFELCSEPRCVRRLRSWMDRYP